MLDKISIESRGFDAISKDIWPSVVVTYNKNKFTLDRSKSDLDVNGEQIFGDGETREHKAKVGMIVGIVVAVLAVIAIIVVIIIVLRKRNGNRESVRIYVKKLLASDQLNDNNFHDPSPNSNNQQA